MEIMLPKCKVNFKIVIVGQMVKLFPPKGLPSFKELVWIGMGMSIIIIEGEGGK